MCVCQNDGECIDREIEGFAVYIFAESVDRYLCRLVYNSLVIANSNIPCVSIEA